MNGKVKLFDVHEHNPYYHYVVTVIISLMAWNNYSLMNPWIMNPYQVTNRGQYHRLITSGFLHADWGHLFFNMISLYFFGGFIEQVFGILFGASGPLYLVGLLPGRYSGFGYSEFLKHRNDPGYNSLGASGGVSAIVFAAILFRPLNRIYLFFIPIPIPGFIFGGLYLAYSYYESRRGAGANESRCALLRGRIWGAFMIVVYPAVLTQLF